ncbi:MAG: hypothetical protein DRR16_32670 [Candidatus Parabeggiatoa sp. nov. 3]|nr:MAG: hypothetical protein DRR00_32955 [Gammaproteobacteria bacterium]RKZ54974.1 MAG: hypothetical protein DRQ99_30625 [Gammaproteobacteria bacterium]RKZ73880.1 MAG: hypothetical protein DRR16_32670 [Gammaproteobacteria bacterium]
MFNDKVILGFLNDAPKSVSLKSDGAVWVDCGNEVAIGIVFKTSIKKGGFAMRNPPDISLCYDLSCH